MVERSLFENLNRVYTLIDQINRGDRVKNNRLKLSLPQIGFLNRFDATKYINLISSFFILNKPVRF